MLSVNGPFRMQRKSMAEDVADELRKRILAGELAEGTQLLQTGLAQEFGTSKVPVREALILLESEGFVTQNFHRGAVVAHSSPQEMYEMFELRAHIETWLIGLALPNVTGEHVAAARRCAEQFLGAESPVQAWEMNWAFHEALYHPAGRPHVLEQLRKLHDQTGKYVIMQYRLAVDEGRGALEHDEILMLYETKDKKIIKLINDHIMVAAKRMVKELSAK